MCQLCASRRPSQAVPGGLERKAGVLSVPHESLHMTHIPNEQCDAPDKNRTCARGLGSRFRHTRRSCKRTGSAASEQGVRQSLRQSRKNNLERGLPSLYRLLTSSSHASDASRLLRERRRAAANHGREGAALGTRRALPRCESRRGGDADSSGLKLLLLGAAGGLFSLLVLP